MYVPAGHCWGGQPAARAAVLGSRLVIFLTWRVVQQRTPMCHGASRLPTCWCHQQVRRFRRSAPHL